MSETLIIITGTVLIAAIVLFWLKLNKSIHSTGKEEIEGFKKEIDSLSSDKRVLEEKVQSLIQRLQKSENILDGKDENILELNRQLSTKTADFNNIQKKLQEQKAELEAIQEKFRTEFKNLANEILEEKSKKFTEQNKKNLDQLLQPLGEKIRDFEKKVEETYDKESKQRFSLEKEIKNLADLNQQISKEANDLTNALKGQSKTRGNWGEIILESILEKSGLVRDREYFVQPSFTNEHGKRVQPDVVVSYPGERNVVIDSKVSLNAYERYASSEVKEDQEAALKDHLLSIRNHINDLSSKNYQDLYQLKSLDFVMMFLPIEPAYMIAMQYDTNLWNFAYERRILLISPTNLIAALKMIATLWRVEYQNKNAQEIAEQSGSLYDKFVGFLEDLRDVGNKLNATQRSYDDSINKLSEGKGNLIRRVERIKELGARTTKEIPKNLIEKGED
jgi:DNA recombination protein RmuC